VDPRQLGTAVGQALALALPCFDFHWWKMTLSHDSIPCLWRASRSLGFRFYHHLVVKEVVDEY
jgi:hypothetical protein